MRLTALIIFNLFFLITSNCLFNSSASAQPVPNCVCAACGAACGTTHKSTCPYYVAPKSKTTSSSKPIILTPANNMNMMIASTLMQGLLNGIFSSDQKAQQQKAQQQQLLLQQQQIKLAQEKAKQQHIKDSIDLAMYMKLMKSYKQLDGAQNLGIKQVGNTNLGLKSLDEMNAAYSNNNDVLLEQQKLDALDSAWMNLQRQLIADRQENKWSKGIMNSLQNNAPPLPFKKFDELEPGDVILLAPNDNDLGGQAVKLGTQLTDLSRASDASHTITYLKEVNGKKIFLDNMPGEGPKIKTEEQIHREYDSRDASVAKSAINGVAQPLKPDEAQRLYEKALELAKKELDSEKGIAYSVFGQTNYGLGKDNLVCSGASWELLKSTGRELPISRSWIINTTGIDFSPADFYNNTQYFLVTPLSMSK